MSVFGIIPFDELFPQKVSPSPNDRLFGYDMEGNVNAAFTLQSIISMLENSNPDWADIENKPTSFPPSAHTLGSHSNVGNSVDTATDNQILRRQSGQWVNWTPNFLTSETDPTVPDWVKSILEQEKANWNQAFGWGNHAGQYRPIDWVPAWGQVSGKPSLFPPSAHTLGSHSNVGNSVDTASTGQLLRRNGSVWEPWTPDFISSFVESDPFFQASPAAQITLGQISNWDGKLSEWADFDDYVFPYIINGVAKPSSFKAVLSENPDPEDDGFVPELIAYFTNLPIKSPPASEPDELVRLDQIPNYTRYGLIDGGQVIWEGGFQFSVLPAIYAIQGIHQSGLDTITGNAAHPTLPRKDAIGVNVLGEVIYKQGDAAEVPLPPYFDPQTELMLTSYDVPAAATEPEGISTTVIYAENVEWTGSSSGTGTANFASTVKPASGTVSTEASNVQNLFNIRYNAPAPVDLTNASTLSLDLSLKAEMFAGHNISIGFLDASGNAATNFIFLNFDKANLDYQTVGIALSAFNWFSYNVKELSITFLRSRGAQVHQGFFLDNIKIQGGIQQPQPPTADFPEAPDNGQWYARRNTAWQSFIPIQDQAIVDGLEAALVDSPGSGNRFVTVNLLNSYSYVQDAPTDGSFYARKDGSWSAITPFSVAGTPSEGDVVAFVSGNPTWQTPSSGGGNPIDLTNRTVVSTSGRLDNLATPTDVLVITSSTDITGFEPTSSGFLRIIISNGSNCMFRNNSSFSSASNRIVGISGNVRVISGTYFDFMYDLEINRWIAVGYQTIKAGGQQGTNGSNVISGGANTTTAPIVELINGAGVRRFYVQGNGLVVTSNWPTSDPLIAGALWNDSGTVKISAG